MTELKTLSCEELAHRCAQESSKKLASKAKRDDSFCYELLRRAFGVDEDADALTQAFNIYWTTWSKSWIRDERAFDSRSLTADDFRHDAFYRVYEELKGTSLESFAVLNALLAYMHTTLVRLIAEHLRKRSNQDAVDVSSLLESIPSEENLDQEAEKNLLLQAIRDRLDKLLPRETKDRVLFECWSNGMSRAEIVRTYSNWWLNENDVRVDVQRVIYRKLNSDRQLRDLLTELRGYE